MTKLAPKSVAGSGTPKESPEVFFHCKIISLGQRRNWPPNLRPDLHVPKRLTLGVNPAETPQTPCFFVLLWEAPKSIQTVALCGITGALRVVSRATARHGFARLSEPHTA